MNHQLIERSTSILRRFITAETDAFEATLHGSPPMVCSPVIGVTDDELRSIVSGMEPQPVRRIIISALYGVGGIGLVREFRRVGHWEQLWNSPNKLTLNAATRMWNALEDLCWPEASC